MAQKPVTYHWLRLRTVAHPTESVDKVVQALRFVAGTDAQPADTVLETHHGLPQHVLEVTLERAREIRALLGRILALPEARRQLADQIEGRTDEDGVFYVRVDKQEAYAGRLALTVGEDCVQLRLKVEAYPATREAALAILRRILAA